MHPSELPAISTRSPMDSSMLAKFPPMEPIASVSTSKRRLDDSDSESSKRRKISDDQGQTPRAKNVPSLPRPRGRPVLPFPPLSLLPARSKSVEATSAREDWEGDKEDEEDEEKDKEEDEEEDEDQDEEDDHTRLPYHGLLLRLAREEKSTSESFPKDSYINPFFSSLPGTITALSVPAYCSLAPIRDHRSTSNSPSKEPLFNPFYNSLPASATHDHLAAKSSFSSATSRTLSEPSTTLVVPQFSSTRHFAEWYAARTAELELQRQAYATAFAAASTSAYTYSTEAARAVPSGKYSYSMFPSTREDDGAEGEVEQDDAVADADVSKTEGQGKGAGGCSCLNCVYRCSL